MPEGDSVFRLAARLRPVLVGATVTGGELRSGASAGSALGGVGVAEVDTVGKHLLMRIDDGRTLHTHLRMQGSWTVTAAGRMLPKAAREKARVRMVLGDGRTVWGIDLPVVEMIPTARETDAIGHLGPDPLRDDWDAVDAVRRLKRDPGRPLVAALLDQRNVAGFGNLWVNELAFLQGVFPFQAVGDVDIGALIDRGARALRISATVPGMYQVTTGRNVRGETHWVAGRAGRPCLRCGTVVRVRAEVPNDPGQRRTWWCPQCQPLREADRADTATPMDVGGRW